MAKNKEKHIVTHVEEEEKPSELTEKQKKQKAFYAMLRGK